MTVFEGTDGAPLPEAVVAKTTNEYGVPLIKLVTVQFLEPVVLHTNPPGVDETVYPVIGSEPVLAGALHETFASALPADALTPVGASVTGSGSTTSAASVSTLPSTEDADSSTAAIVASTAFSTSAATPHPLISRTVIPTITGTPKNLFTATPRTRL